MQTVVSPDGTQIAYDRTGQGPALVLVAGAFSYRRYPPLVRLAELLAQHHTVYSYDRRGRGDSGDSQPFAIDREIEDLGSVISAAGGSASVWGLSSGAILALKAAAGGLNIVKLALQEPPLFLEASARRPPADLADHLTDLIGSGRRDDAIKYFMVQGMGAPRFVIPMMHLVPGAWRQLKAVAHTLPYDARLLELPEISEPLYQRAWSRMTMSTLVMAGSESPTFLRHDAEALTAVLPNARVEVRKGLGHTKKLSPKAIAAVLIEFLADRVGETASVQPGAAAGRA